MMNKINLLAAVFFLFGIALYAKTDDYKYKRKLSKIENMWNQIDVSNNILSKIKYDFSDIRIIGVTSNKDTIEAPYFIKNSGFKIKVKEAAFKLLNESNIADNYFFTFENIYSDAVNKITLNFKQSNFDWKLKLEGSQDLNIWFDIVDNYRILSIKNPSAEYKFSDIIFTESKYKFYRIKISADEKPILLSATLQQTQLRKDMYQEFKIKSKIIEFDKTSNKTIIKLQLNAKMPVSCIRFNINDKVDYYRPVSISKAINAFKTETGIHNNYNEIAGGILNSIDINEIKFEPEFAKDFKIEIENKNNSPLNIGSIEMLGFNYSIIARFSEKADYYLIYGNSNANPPEYDINMFKDKIPDSLNILNPEPELVSALSTNNNPTPVEVNKLWLWVVLLVIIVLLGVFTYKMLQNKE